MAILTFAKSFRTHYLVLIRLKLGTGSTSTNVLFKQQSPINPMNHLHVTTHILTSLLKLKEREYWQQHGLLMYVTGHRFLYWRYHEIPRYMCLLDVVGRAMGRWSSDSFQRHWCPLDEITLNRDHV